MTLKEKLLNRQQEILEYIDNMVIYDEDYDNIQYLVENMDDSLFLKVMDEVVEANDYNVFRLFTRALALNNYNITKLKKNLQTQDELYNEYTLLLKYLQTELNDYNNYKLKALAVINNEIIDKAKADIVLDFITTDNTTSIEEFTYKKIILSKLLDPNSRNDILDAILLSSHEYLVPVDKRFIELTDNDKKFMELNNVSENEMKHIKSIAALSAGIEYDNSSTEE